ncbi:PREDICTED: uncharacterized protein LOC108971087 [Bactrocera latifrons]|uniref:uncharacterized protein LOC108971087 n=1 Tax=Bactrocera latifrons TaxID=174628 RepID=UPI0008DD2800|nr:PREDICTED: uncharacterized protein LOC108971087 [Bactrocera latifrons]
MALQNLLQRCVLNIAKPSTFAPTSLIQPVRFSSSVGGCILPKHKKKPAKLRPGRKCIPYKVPICSEEVLKKKRKSRPCQMKADVQTIDPECCPNPCIDMYPRFDDLYYAPSEKNRRYQQTWCEFGSLRITKQPRCCYEELDIPMPKRRKPKRGRSIDLCEVARKCPNVSPKCVKLVWPGCRTNKCTFKCSYYPPPKDCLKICTPYPSFSECERDLPKPLHPVECNCLESMGFCPP